MAEIILYITDKILKMDMGEIETTIIKSINILTN